MALPKKADAGKGKTDKEKEKEPIVEKPKDQDKN